MLFSFFETRHHQNALFFAKFLPQNFELKLCKLMMTVDHMPLIRCVREMHTKEMHANRLTGTGRNLSLWISFLPAIQWRPILIIITLCVWILKIAVQLTPDFRPNVRPDYRAPLHNNRSILWTFFSVRNDVTIKLKATLSNAIVELANLLLRLLQI